MLAPVSTAAPENDKLESSPAAPSNESVPARHARPADWSDVSYHQYLSMRDGVRLAINIYFPDHMPLAKPAPVVLVPDPVREGRGATQRQW